MPENRRAIMFGQRTGQALAMLAQTSYHPTSEANGRGVDTNRMYVVRITDITNTPADGIVQQVSDPQTGKLEDIEDGDCKVTGLAGMTLTPNSLVVCRLSANWVDPDDDENELPLYIGASGGDESLWATITSRAKDVRGNWCYGWQEDLPKKFGQWMAGPRSGTTGAWVEVVLFSETDGATVGEIWTVAVHSATSGTFRLCVDGVATSDIAYNASGSTISAALVAAGASLIAGTFQFTDYDEHTLTWCKNDLKPNIGVNLLYDCNNLKINPFQRERIWHGYHAHPKLTITKTHAGDDVNFTTFTVAIEDVAGGTYTLDWDESGDTAPIVWDADATAVETAINLVAGGGTVVVSGWSKDSDDKVTYTVTATTHPPDPEEDYTLTGDGKNLVGADDWRVRWVKGADTTPPDVSGVCVDVVTDVTWDDTTCTPSKTLTTIKVLGEFTDHTSCTDSLGGP